MKNTFDGLIRRLDMTKERISELEVRSIKTPKNKLHKGKRMKNKNVTSKSYGSIKRCNIYVMDLPKEKKDKIEQKKYLKY